MASGRGKEDGFRDVLPVTAIPPVTIRHADTISGSQDADIGNGLALPHPVPRIASSSREEATPHPVSNIDEAAFIKRGLSVPADYAPASMSSHAMCPFYPKSFGKLEKTKTHERIKRHRTPAAQLNCKA
jgi:hypothetical protein